MTDTIMVTDADIAAAKKAVKAADLICDGYHEADIDAVSVVIAHHAQQAREELVAYLSTIEPDEEAAGCSATWGDFLQIAQDSIRRPRARCC